MLLRVQTALLTALIAAGTVLPASAQGLSSDEMQRLNEMQRRMPNIGRAYGIRITTGASNNAGFEKPLVNSDPNLKHWCWIPVTNYNQAYIRKAPGQTGQSAGSPKRPASVYVRPTKVALPTVDHGEPQRVVRISGSDSSRSSSDVSAKLSFKKPPAKIAYEAETKSYGNSYSDVSGRLMPPRYNNAGYSASRDVFGKIVSRTETH